MKAGTDWRTQWVVDEDADAAAQAIHSSGAAVAIRLDEARVWVAEAPHQYQPEMERLRRMMGDAVFAAFQAARQDEALQLWRELGYEDGGSAPRNPRPFPLPCRLASWRSHWKFGQEGATTAQAVHSSGLGFQFLFTELDVSGAPGWIATLAPQAEKKAALLLQQFGTDAYRTYMERLRFEAHTIRTEHAAPGFRKQA